MSLTKEAIEHIQGLGNLDQLIAELINIEPDTPVLPVPSNVKLESLEQFMPNAMRYRMNYRTDSIADYLDYCICNDRDGALCFVDSRSMTAESIFDLGTVAEPKHQEHKASLRLNKTAAFNALLLACDDRMSQKRAADFISDWAEQLTITASCGDDMTAEAAAASLRDLTIDTAKEFNSKIDEA